MLGPRIVAVQGISYTTLLVAVQGISAAQALGGGGTAAPGGGRRPRIAYVATPWHLPVPLLVDLEGEAQDLQQQIEANRRTRRRRDEELIVTSR